MKYILIGVIFCFIECNQKKQQYADQFQVASQLMHALMKNDAGFVLKIMGTNLKAIGRDSEGLKFDVNQASLMIKKYGMPDEKHYKFSEFPERSANLVDITIPFSIPDKSNLNHPGLIIHFVRYLPSDKILDFRVIQDLNNK